LEGSSNVSFTSVSQNDAKESNGFQVSALPTRAGYNGAGADRCLHNNSRGLASSILLASVLASVLHAFGELLVPLQAWNIEFCSRLFSAEMPCPATPCFFNPFAGPSAKPLSITAADAIANLGKRMLSVVSNKHAEIGTRTTRNQACSKSETAIAVWYSFV